MKNKPRLRRLIFALLILVTVCFQFSFGKFFAIGEAIPLLVLPLVISISVHENSLSAILFGVLSGALSDMFSISEDGFYIVVFTLAAFVSSNLVIFKMRRTFLNTCFFTAFWAIALNVAYWFFFVALKHYDLAGSLLVSKYLATAVYSFVFVAVYYPIVKGISKAFEKNEEGEWISE